MSDDIGPLIIDVAGPTLSSEDLELLNHPLVGGIILFARNFESRRQLTTLCSHIRAARRQPCLIMVDQEGGRVQRFLTDFTRLPDLGTLGCLYDEQPQFAIDFAKECGWLMATELLAASIDLSLAPVLDLNRGVSTVIGHRAFHAQPESVIALAQSYIAGMKSAGMTACAKHFPGHGSVALDSHVALPYDDRPLSEIRQRDLKPFAALIQSGLVAMMAAHIIFREVDAKPVGYSYQWLHQILRNDLGFKGLVFSDDLNMEGANISSHYRDRVVAAKEAGCDLTLLCNNRAGVIEVLNDLPAEAYRLSPGRWQALCGLSDQFTQKYTQLSRWQKINATLTKFSGQSSLSWEQLRHQLLSWKERHANHN